MIPYFESLNKQKRLCPQCCKDFLYIEETLNPNAAFERCKCRYYQVILAPDEFKVKVDVNSKPKAKSKRPHLKFV